MTTPSVDQLAVALHAAELVLVKVRAEQWNSATPCEDWNVRELVNHLVVGNQRFASILRGEASPPMTQAAESDDQMLRAYGESAASVLDAFSQPGVLNGVFTVPFGTVAGFVALHLRLTEALVHGWDLARATGQPAEFPEDLAEQELAFSLVNVPNIPPGRSPFASPQPVTHNASAIDKLAAYLGRSVSWAPPSR